MTHPADTVRTIAFVAAGGDSRGLLTDGLLETVSLVQMTLGGSPHAFAASGTHTTRFVRGAFGRPTELAMATPGVGASHLHRLELAGDLWITQGSAVATGPLVTLGAGPHEARNAWGFPTGIEAAGVDVDGLTLENVPLRIVGGTLTKLDNVTFNSFPGSATQLTISHPGTVSPFIIQGLAFSSLPTTGFYLDAVDSDGTAPALTLEVHSTLAPGVGAAGTRTTAGPGPVQALVTWP